MPPLACSWKHDAAAAYLDTLQSLGLALEVVNGDRLRIPPGHTPAEVELVRLLKTELAEMVERQASTSSEAA